MKWFKRTFQNLLLVAISVSLAIIAINVLFRANALHIVNQHIFPRALLNYLGDHYHTFYPSVNDKTLTNWNAVLGDSYAAGAGDPYLNNMEMYGWIHFLRKKSNENYYIFGRSGFGSANSVREFVVTVDEIRNSIFYPRYAPPKKVLFLFYEGNDLNNNLIHFAKSGTRSDSLYDFVKTEIEKPVEAARVNKVAYPVIMLLRDVYRDRNKLFANSRQEDAQAAPAEVKNYVIIDNKRYEFSIVPQAAAAELGEDQTNLALSVLFDSIRYLKSILPGAVLEIVYLPSVVTVYTWVDPVHFETYHTSNLVATNYQSNLSRSKYIRNRILEFSNSEGVAFIDTSEDLIASGRNLFVHGPLDLRHFNEIGHQIVGETIFRKEVALARKSGQ